MNKEKLKKIKVLYYPYKTLKQGGMDILNEVHYRFSLHYIEKNKNRVRKIGRVSGFPYTISACNSLVKILFS